MTIRRLGRGLPSFMKIVIDYLLYVLARIIFALVAFLPEPVGRAIISSVLWLVFAVEPRFQKIAFRNMQIAFPEMSKEEQRRLFSSWRSSFSGNLCALARLSTYSREQLEEMFDYGQYRELHDKLRAESNGLGVLFPTMHFGSFELFVFTHSLFYRPISILARPFNIPPLDRWINRRRGVYGNQVFNKRGAYREISKRLRQGQDVTLLCDQNMKRREAVYVDFFGLKASTTKSVALAALRTRAKVVLAVSCEVAPMKYTCVFEELQSPYDFEGSKEEKIECFTAALNKKMEEIIRAYPEHWYWIHRRWKGRPLGEKEDIYD